MAMIVKFDLLEWLGTGNDGALLFVAKAGTYQILDGPSEMFKGEDVTVRYSPEKWDALRLQIIEKGETDIVVAGDEGPRFRFPRRIYDRLLKNIN